MCRLTLIPFRLLIYCCLHSALQDDDSELSDSILRSRYNEAIQAHLHTPVKAVALYDALLNDARLQRAPLAALSESIHDPFDSGVASIRMRMKLRGLILKNRAKLEEELADEQYKKTNSSPQQASTSSSSFSSTPSSSSSPSYSSSLQLYLDAIDAIESSQLLESRLLTMQRAEGITTSHSTADTRLHQPSHSQSPATLTELYDSNLLVDDCEIWLRTARMAWLNKKYSIARQALETGESNLKMWRSSESSYAISVAKLSSFLMLHSFVVFFSAFKLSPDNFNVLEQVSETELIDVEAVCRR